MMQCVVNKTKPQEINVTKSRKYLLLNASGICSKLELILIMELLASVQYSHYTDREGPKDPELTSHNQVERQMKIFENKSTLWEQQVKIPSRGVSEMMRLDE